MYVDLKNMKLEQISNFVYCDAKLNEMNIESKLLPNPYYDYPFLILEEFLEEDLCDKINLYIDKKNEFENASLRTKNSINLLDKKVNKKIRNTNLYKLDKFLEKIYYKKFCNVQEIIEDYFKLPITSSTDIQVLEYKKGYFYKAHSDDSSMIYKKDELIGFSSISKQRKLTTVLFTTSFEDDFYGGELKFNFLYDESSNHIQIKPKKGQMLVFLSNPYFTHEVLPIVEGRRITIVQWHNSI